MRVVVSAVFAAALASAGVAAAQVPGQPMAARASYTVEPFTPAGQVTIQGTGVRLRAEPFSTPQTQVLSSGSTGLALNVVGIARLADWNWYQVVLKNGQKAFIRSDLTSAPSRGGGQGAPAPTVIASTPTPPPTPPAYVPPAYTPPAPIDPQPVQLSPPVVVQPLPPADTSGRPPLDLPRPSDPAGLQSH